MGGRQERKEAGKEGGRTGGRPHWRKADSNRKESG